jgi:hypothetical protein
VAQVIQVVGSLLVLLAFVGSQRGTLTTTSRVYLVLNFVGSGILATLAAIDLQYGFLLLEGVWAIVSAVGLVKSLRAPRPEPQT